MNGIIGPIKRSVIIVIVSIFTFAMVFYQPAIADTDAGTVTGKIVDSETGEPLPGVTIRLEDTNLGAVSDLDGIYRIKNVPSGNYNLNISLLGYAETTIKSLEVPSSDVVELDASLIPEALAVNDIVVEAQAIYNNETALLKQRQHSNTVSNAISAEAISQFGSGDAGAALKHVTGVTVMGGKYVLVRGLGDRYSNAQLNGAELPSADPDQKSFQMDLLPSNLLENIVVKKSFTPDNPGDFSGGMVDIGTKTYPETFTMKFSTSASVTRGTTGNDNYLTYPGGDTDWLGMDDGTRAIPEILDDDSLYIPTWGEARMNDTLAYRLDSLSNAFNNDVMTPVSKVAPMNKNFNLSVGNQTSVFGRQLGYIMSFGYKRTYDFYKNGTLGKWQAPTDADEMSYQYLYKDNRGVDEANWGGLGMLSFKPHRNHEIATNYIYTQSGESTARFVTGDWPEALPEGGVYEQRGLKYQERNLQSIQARGHHYWSRFFNLDMDWSVSYSYNRQEEPNLRFFSNHFVIFERNGVIDTVYKISPNQYSVPKRYFQNLEEDNITYNLNFSFPFKQWYGQEGRLKFGGLVYEKTRINRIRGFQWSDLENNWAFIDSTEGDPDDFLSPEYTGIVDSTVTPYFKFFSFGNLISETTPANSNYDGEKAINAVYTMMELPINRQFELIGGVRYEETEMQISFTDQDTTLKPLEEYNLLTSASIIYKLYKGMNIRFAYGKTLARPTVRELVPFATYDLLDAFHFNGNDSLKITLIDNFDLRWEWFRKPGEIYAISLFTKKFYKPIEWTKLGPNSDYGYVNVDEAKAYGLELEFRQRLDMIHPQLSNFITGGNFSLIRSSIKIPNDRLNDLRDADPDAKDTRPMQGQSPYIVNFYLGYDNVDWGTSADIVYNVFGKRLSIVGEGFLPDVYEQPSPILNFGISQRIFYKLNLKFSAKNLLHSSYKEIQSFRGKDYIFREYSKKQSFSLGLSYDIN